MSATTVFVIGIIAAAALASAGVFAVAIRREPSVGPITDDFDRRSSREAKEARRIPRTSDSDAVRTSNRKPTRVIADEVDRAPEAGIAETATGDGLLDREQVSSAEYGVTRRKFLNRATLGLFGGVFLGGQLSAYLAFLWPKLKGGFGSKINVGNLEEIRLAVTGPSITPKFFAAAQAWVVPIEADVIAESQFADIPVVVGADGGEVGIMALWQRCVHLGCRVPSCVPSQGFECVCHGSRYNFHGEFEDGPAPRNLDRFEVGVNDEGDLIVNTGAIFQTARAKNKTIIYPQGPSCIKSING